MAHVIDKTTIGKRGAGFYAINLTLHSNIVLNGPFHSEDIAASLAERIAGGQRTQYVQAPCGTGHFTTAAEACGYGEEMRAEWLSE
jgi:hypothetical protein